MATSSMHKPGWRSRRRSRLSLVERAVPRLGRLPEAEGGVQTVQVKDAAATSSPQAKVSIERRSMGEAACVVPADYAAIQPAETTPGADLNGASATRLQGPDRGPDDVLERIDGTHDHVSAGMEPETGLDAGAEAGAATALNGEAAAAANITEAGDTSPAIERTADGGPSPWPSTMRPDVASGGLIDDAAVPLDRGASGQGGPLLRLDWQNLIANGFTDPRNRSRPLPKPMHDIIRALVRQALSDQSSWRDRVILVTSPNERRSKTTAAINFAFGLTTVADHHAVLIDVDTAGSGAVDRLGGGDHAGITAALADEGVKLGDLVIPTDLDRLTLVASGAAGEDTLDRFASRRMLQIMRYLTERPEALLVIDAPPILHSQEAAVLSVIAGQVVLSVEAGRTTADQIEHALQRIGDRHNVSLVLNESSGLGQKDAAPSAPLRGREPAALNRRAPEIKRRLPRSATASALVLGLLAAQPAVQVGGFPADVMLPPTGYGAIEIEETALSNSRVDL